MMHSVHLFRGWWPEQIDLTFPTSVDATVAILAAGVVPRRELRGLRTTQDRVLTGAVQNGRLAVTCTRPRVHYSWEFILRGRLVPNGTGCRLEGSLGWHPLARLVTVLLLFVVVATVLGLFEAGHTTAGSLLPAVAFPVIYLIGITVAGRSADSDTALIRQWLTDAQREQARS